MTTYKMKLSEGAAIFVILLFAGVVVFAISFTFHAFSFPWVAWCGLGFGAIVTFGRELIVVRDPSDEPASGEIDSTLITMLSFLFSTPVLFVIVAAALTLLFASMDSFGVLPTLASVSALYFLVKHALRI